MHRDFDQSAYATLAELEDFDRLTSELNAAAMSAMRPREVEPASAKAAGEESRAAKHARMA